MYVFSSEMTKLHTEYKCRVYEQHHAGHGGALGTQAAGV